MRGKLLRPLAWLLVGVTTSVALLSGTIRLDQYLLRWRAERLQSDIRSLELRKSKYADARRVIDIWWNHAREQGPCRPDWCDVEITLTDFTWSHPEYIFRTPTRSRISRWLGARPATVDAGIRVRNNVIVGKRIGGYILGPCFDSGGQTFCTTMIGHVSTGRRRFIDLRHPEYTFYKPSGCEICVDADVILSPYASPADVRRLTDVNFGCITRWSPRENEGDILPTAWAQARSEGAKPAQVGTCSETIRALGRELACVPLATVTRVTDIGDGPNLSVRWEDQCGMSGPEGRQNNFHEPNVDLHIRSGDRLLVFEDQLFHYSNPCAVVLATEENLRAAREGASENTSDHTSALSLPFDGIAPPRIDVRLRSRVGSNSN